MTEQQTQPGSALTAEDLAGAQAGRHSGQKPHEQSRVAPSCSYLHRLLHLWLDEVSDLRFGCPSQAYQFPFYFLNSSRPFSLLVFTLVLLLLPFPCCREFLSPLFPEAQQPVCSRAQHWIRSQQLPLKLRCIITTSCSCSGRLAGRLCKQAS